MPPQLTEAWSVAYLQILITLIVFALSILSILLQFSLSENYQYIVNKYMKKYLLLISITISFVLIFSLSFIWVLHPFNVDIPSWKNWTGSSIVSLSLVFIIILWWKYIRKLSKKNVIGYLAHRVFKKFTKYGSQLNDETIDLITLGERSEAGYEKEIVLDALADLIKKIQDADGYDGHDLEYIIRDFVEIVAGKDKPGNVTDFIKAVEILRQSIIKLAEKNFSDSGDAIVIYYTLKEIGKKSIELNLSKQVIMRIVEVTSDNSSTLFEIGSSAFKSGEYSAANSALSKLESLALDFLSESETKPKEELQETPTAVYNLFGLMAYFWTEKNSSRQRAEAFLNANREEFTPLYRYLSGAIKYHYQSARYDTADKLMKMSDELIKT